VGVANSDGGKRPGGLGSSSLDCRRTFVHPSRHAGGELLEKHSVFGRDYCSAGLEGAGMKRRLVLQPELRELIARLSQHRPTLEKLGQRLSEVEYLELKAGLGREDVQVVRRFLPGEGEQQPVAAETKRRLLVQQHAMVREKNAAMLRLLEGIEADLERRGMSQRVWQHWPLEWGELLYDLGAHDSDCGIIGHSGGLAVVRRLLLGDGVTLDDRRLLGAHSPILRRALDAHGGTQFPRFFLPALHKLYELTLLARGGTAFEDAERDGWVVAALRPLGHAVELQRVAAERPLNEQEAALLTYAAATASSWLPGVQTLEPFLVQWTDMTQRERDLLWQRLGLDEEGARLHPLPPRHSFRAEQDALAHYALPGWEQKRGLPRYSTFEHPNGRSKTSEETKCNSGRTETEWDAANTPGLTRGGGKASKPGGKRPNKSRGAVVFCCPHRVIYGFHVMLRGESPRDVFAVLYTRLNREHLPRYLVYDNACALRNY
jgi:hypothetical protein